MGFHLVMAFPSLSYALVMQYNQNVAIQLQCFSEDCSRCNTDLHYISIMFSNLVCSLFGTTSLVLCILRIKCFSNRPAQVIHTSA
jgi:hypothetical protein